MKGKANKRFSLCSMKDGGVFGVIRNVESYIKQVKHDSEGYINSRDIYKDLNIAQRYNDWVRCTIPIFKPVEGVDFILIRYDSCMNVIANNDYCTHCGRKDYLLSEEFAKNIIIYHSVRNVADDCESENNRCTYLILDTITGYTKIGKTNDLEDRFKALSISNMNMKIIAVLNKDMEHFYHSRYGIKHIYGEWYNLNIKDIKNLLKEGFVLNIPKNELTKYYRVRYKTYNDSNKC